MFLDGLVHGIEDLVDGMLVLMGFVHQNGVFVDKLWQLSGFIHQMSVFVDKLLEQFLFADCSYEFFEIERFEVSNVFESFFVQGSHGRGEHCLCVRMTLAEVGVRVLDHVCAFACTVADEEARALLEIFGEAGFVDDCWGCFGDLEVGRRSFAALRMTIVLRMTIGLWMTIALRMTNGLRTTWREYCSVDFHAAGVDHWDDEAGIPDQVGDDVADLIGYLRLCYQGVKCADCEEWLLGTKAESFGC